MAENISNGSDDGDDGDDSVDLPICFQCQKEFDYVGKLAPKLCSYCRKIDQTQLKQQQEENKKGTMGKKRAGSHI